jgi:hypothetical protein
MTKPYDKSAIIETHLTESARQLKLAITLMVERGDDCADLYPVGRSITTTATDERTRRRNGNYDGS